MVSSKANKLKSPLTTAFNLLTKRALQHQFMAASLMSLTLISPNGLSICVQYVCQIYWGSAFWRVLQAHITFIRDVT